MKKFKNDKTITGKQLNSEECDKCKKERAARTAVATKHDDERFGQEPFSTAPYIHQLNDPKHTANLQRSMIWAETHQRSINWVTAHDYPPHRDNQAILSLSLFVCFLLIYAISHGFPKEEKHLFY